MPESRPAIPADIERDILIESGHRCAVCGTGTPLERAHIVPWHKSKEHKAEDLICLCANCHERADNEKWGEKTLREYKFRPWVLRQFEKTDPPSQDTTEVEIRIKAHYAHFAEKDERVVKFALAAFLDLNPNNIVVVSRKKSSVLLTVQLPTTAAKRLINSFKENEEELLRYLAPYSVLSIAERQRIYVGTLVGESTSQSFRLAIAHDTVQEQDIIAVDAELSKRGNGSAAPQKVRVWAKVQSIERINPLFPMESGHELAATKTDPLDTVLSFSREMVTALCQVIGAESLENGQLGKLEHLRYPPRPASSAYLPPAHHLERILLGSLQEDSARALDIAYLSNRPDISVKVDGHAIVTRHLAVLAMTGAGKSWTARRIIEELARKNYPIVIFDPHGDYTGLGEVPSLHNKVQRYYAKFPIFEEDSETIAEVVSSLGYPLTDTMKTRFGDVFTAAKLFSKTDNAELTDRAEFLFTNIHRTQQLAYAVEPNMWLIAYIAELGETVLRSEDSDKKAQLVEWGWESINTYSKTDVRTLEAIKKRAFAAAKVLSRMERTNRQIAKSANPLPPDRKELVRYGGVSVVSLAGYTGDFQATIYSLVADNIFEARVNGELKLPVLLLLEEAHSFVPSKANTPAEQRSISTTKQIAQEGRKFGVGLILVSQRPSRLDETTLSQCNSYIIMRMVNPADQNFVRKVVESLSEDEARMLPGLDVGEAILAGQLTSFPVLVRIKPPESSGEREEQDAFVLLEQSRLGHE